MKKLIRLSLLLVFMLAFHPAISCDVNLFAIISGASIENEFSDEMNKLSSAVQELGSSYEHRETAARKLENLMNLWLEFSARFSQFPPEWAAQDSEWQKKIGHLSTIIGNIRSNLADNRDDAHRFMLKFSRQLPQLYRKMPMTALTGLLLDFTLCFDHIWDAYYEKDLNSFRARITELSHKLSRLDKLLGEDYTDDLENFKSQVDSLRRQASQINVFKTVTIELAINDSESLFVQINEKLSNQTAP